MRIFCATFAAERWHVLILGHWGGVAVGLGILLGVDRYRGGFWRLDELNYLLAGTVGINPVLGNFQFPVLPGG
jgi:hypothetical protein